MNKQIDALIFATALYIVATYALPDPAMSMGYVAVYLAMLAYRRE